MKRVLLYGTLAACMVGGVHAAGFQQPVFRGAADLVRVYVTVTDRDGRIVTSLEQADFEVRDDGKPQPIAVFDNTPQPIRIVVMLDVSGSMAGNLPLLRAGAEQLFARLRPDDLARVGEFGHNVTISPSFTRDPRELREALPTSIAGDAPTPLWRAVDEAMDAFKDEGDERRVVLVLSDGKDSGPTQLTDFRRDIASQAGVIDRAREEDVMVYAIGFRSRGARPPQPPPSRGAVQKDSRQCWWPTCPIQDSRRLRSRPGAATRRFGTGRISGRRSRKSPTSCTVSTSLVSTRRNATARPIRSRSGSNSAA